MKIEQVKLSDLKPDPRNARKHSERNIKAIAHSLDKFGQQKPIVALADGTVIAGNGTLEAAKNLGWKTISVKRFDDPKKAQAYAIADNASGALAEWDDAMLSTSLAELKLEGWNLDGLGFNEKDLRDLPDFKMDYPDEVIPQVTEARVKVGELWLLGNHRVVCGDSFDKKTAAKLFGSQKADFIFTSPPYNADIDYAEYKDKRSADEYLAFIEKAMAWCFKWLKEGRLIGWNIGVSPKTLYHEQAMKLRACGFVFKRQIVWHKPGIPRPIFHQSDRVRKYIPNYQYELIYFASKGNVEFGTGTSMPDEARDDVWKISQSQATTDIPGEKREIPGMPTSKAAAHPAAHPAAFPVALPRTAILCMTGAGEIVYDPFGGAGSTLLACEQTGRKALLSEMTPAYCDLTIARWEASTGKAAVKGKP